jgi:hypothetical protein
VLTDAPPPQNVVVQVLEGTKVLCSAFIDDPIDVEAAAAAARLKTLFRRLRPLLSLAILLD